MSNFKIAKKTLTVTAPLAIRNETAKGNTNVFYDRIRVTDEKGNPFTVQITVWTDKESAQKAFSS